MVSIVPALVILGVLACILSVAMLFAKTPITGALSLLGVMICTAGMYGLIGEHFVASIQLLVYAGAVMVLFIFSIMLLNLRNEKREFKLTSGLFSLALLVGALIFAGLTFFLVNFNGSWLEVGMFTPEKIKELGGNTVVLAHALFTQYYLSFEIVSLALIVALVAAIVLAKRKID